MTDAVERPVRVTGAAAKHVKRELLGIADRRKHHARAATPMRSRTKDTETHQRVYRFRFYPSAEQAEQLE